MCNGKIVGTMSAALLAFLLALAGCAGNMPRTGAEMPSEPEQNPKEQANEYYLAGKMAEAQEDWSAAATAYTEALQFDPASDEIAIAIAKVYLRDGKLRSALAYARVAAGLNGKVSEYWQIIQYLEERGGNFEGAAQALEKYIALTPESGFAQELRLSQYYFALGRTKDARKLLLDHANDPRTPARDVYEAARALAFNDLMDDAVRVLRNLLERDPLDVQAWLSLGELYLNTGDEEQASATFREALSRNPDNLFIIVTIGNQCLVENNWTEAANYFEKAAKAGMEQVEEAGLSYLDILKTLTAVYYYAGRDSDAGDLFDLLKNQEQDDAALYFSLGKAMNFLERFDEAIGYYQAGLTKDLTDTGEEFLVRAYTGYAAALIGAGQGDEALRVIREDAAATIQNNVTLKSIEASIYMELKRFSEAATLYEWLTASDPEDRGYLFSLSVAYDSDGRFDDAEKILLQILEANPEDALALNNLAYMYIDHDRNLAQALKMVRQALIADPNNGAYLDTLGWAYFKLGKFKDARKEIERALKWSGPEDVGVIYEHYGDILVTFDDGTGAGNAYRKAIEAGEDPGRIQPKIDSIGQ